MPAGGEAVIAGQYTVTWNGTSAGIMEGDSGVPTISKTAEAEVIGNTDAYGKTVIDKIHQGVNMFAQFMCIEYTKGVALWWPWGTLGQMGVIGRLHYAMSAALVLTAVSGTPAASSPATLTSSHALLSHGYNTQLLFGPTLRKVPIRLQLFPYVSGSLCHFTTS